MLTLTPDVLNACKREALRAYPREGCGFLLGPRMGIADEFVRVDNIQDALHAKDPERYPRTARTAYAIDPKQHDTVFKTAKARERELSGIFHSHPDHDAYFSAEDKAMAAPWGEPLLPGLAYVVVSVYNKQIRAMKQFYWDDKTKDFVESAMSVMRCV